MSVEVTNETEWEIEAKLFSDLGIWVLDRSGQAIPDGCIHHLFLLYQFMIRPPIVQLPRMIPRRSMHPTIVVCTRASDW